jgi:carbamate kinase
VPVTRDDAGMLHGAEAVVDKDLTTALLARSVDADVLLLTDVDAV